MSISLRDRLKNEEMIGKASVDVAVRKRELIWFGHLMRRKDFGTMKRTS